MFARDGRPNRDDVDWLSSIVPLSAAALGDLNEVPDWRAFYAILLRLPEFAFVREAIDERAFERLLFSLGPPVTMEWPEDRPAEAGPHVGNFDAIERGLARGWLWDPNRPNQPAEIEFVVAGQVVHRAKASYLRTDVRDDGQGSGFAGFETQLPYDLIGSERAIGARLSGSAWQLADSPKRLGMPAELQRWQKRRARVSGHLLSWLRQRLDRATDGGELRFLLPISARTREAALSRTFESVRAQWCSRWIILCLIDATAPTDLVANLRDRSMADSRLELLVDSQSIEEGEKTPKTEMRGTTLLAPIACGDDLEPDTVHRFLLAALAGADIVYADEIRTLDALLDAILPFRRAAFAAEMDVADPAGINLIGYSAAFAHDALVDPRRISRLTEDDFASAISERSNLVVHVPGVFRWRPAAETNVTSSVRQGGLSNLADPQTCPDALRLSLECLPARQILLAATGLVPRSDTIVVNGEARLARRATRRRPSIETREIATHIAGLQTSISFVVRIDGEDETLRTMTISSLQASSFPAWRMWSPDAVDDHLAAGTYLLWIDAGEMLAEHALYWFAARAAAVPAADVLYADQDEARADGTGVRSAFKPDWSPDLLESRDYIDSAVVFRLASAQAHLELSRSRYDLLLRMTDDDLTVVEHVREMAMHRPASVDHLDGGERAMMEMDALRNRLARSGRAGTLTSKQPAARSCYQITLRRDDRPRVSAILALASRDQRNGDPARYAASAMALIDTLRERTGLDLIVVIDAMNVDRPATPSEGRGLRVLEYDRDLPSLPAMINQGAEAASGDLLLVLDGPYFVSEPRGIDRLVDEFAKPGVGVAGATLRAQTEWRGGITLRAGFPSIEQTAAPDDDPTRNTMAVLSPFLTTRTLFGALGGYSDTISPIYCHLDYCFKARRVSKRIVLTSGCRFEDWRTEMPRSQPDIAGLRQLAERWPRAMMMDPYESSLR